MVIFTDLIKKGDKFVEPKKAARQREAYTDSDGKYRFDELPEGRHRLKIFLPDGLTVFKDQWEISTGIPSCSEYDFNAQIDGRISGRIVASDGKPVHKVRIYIGNLEYSPYLYIPSAETDTNGYYELKGIPPGNYKLSVNPNIAANQNTSPFTNYYFGETFNSSEAQIFRLGLAEKLNNVNLKLFPIPDLKKTIVEVVWETGEAIDKPAVYYMTSSERIKGDSPRYAFPDQEGKSIIPIYSGFDYKIYAIGQLKDGRFYETKPLFIKAEQISGPIRLVAAVKK